jgi:hypothetical protein
VVSSRATGVWISTDAADVVRWSQESTQNHRVESDVEGRHRSTGHAPTQHHAQSDGRRDEHLRAYLEQVTRLLPPDEDLLLIGDGEVVVHLGEQVREEDTVHGRHRRVEVVHSGPITVPQLVAKIREFAGHPPTRRAPR